VKVGRPVEVTLDVTNTSALSGSDSRPVRELNGFERITLIPDLPNNAGAYRSAVNSSDNNLLAASSLNGFIDADDDRCVVRDEGAKEHIRRSSLRRREDQEARWRIRWKVWTWES